MILKQIISIFICLFLLAGCSMFDQKKENSLPKAHMVTNGPVAIPPNAQGAEVWFESIPYPPSEEKYPIRSNGGIWPNTKENHSGSISDEFDWNQDEVLYIQLQDPKYKGYDVVPVAVEQIGTEVLKITLQLKETDHAGAKNAKPARVFIKFKKGALYQKRFLVINETGQTLKTS
jgi:hypothetical protein